MPQVTMRDGETVHVGRFGRGEPVLLIHGFASRGAHWLFNILPLMHRYEFFLLDLRGFGRSHHVEFPAFYGHPKPNGALH